MKIIIVLFLSIFSNYCFAQTDSSISEKCDEIIFTKCEEPPSLKIDLLSYQKLLMSYFITKNEFPEKCTITDNYINISNTRFNMSSSENGNGKYHTLNTKIWILIETDEKTDERGRVHLKREYIGKEPSVFVADEYQEPETCKYYVILSKSKWLEVRKIRGKEAGEPLEIQTNGDIWTGHKNKFVKVFVRK